MPNSSVSTATRINTLQHKSNRREINKVVVGGVHRTQATENNAAQRDHLESIITATVPKQNDPFLHVQATMADRHPFLIRFRITWIFSLFQSRKMRQSRMRLRKFHRETQNQDNSSFPKEGQLTESDNTHKYEQLFEKGKKGRESRTSENKKEERRKRDTEGDHNTMQIVKSQKQEKSWTR